MGLSVNLRSVFMLMLCQAVIIGPPVIFRSVCQLCVYLSLLCQSVSLIHISFRPISYMSVCLSVTVVGLAVSYRSTCSPQVQQLVVDLCGGQICVFHG